MKGGFMKKKMFYKVQTQPSNYIVARRYNDFEWLLSTLKFRYTGRCAPLREMSLAMANKRPAQRHVQAVPGGRVFLLHLL
jgi:hypothetical protein